MAGPPISAQSIPSANTPALDAASGFHDIKPLPEFHPFPIEFAAAAAVVLLAAWLLWRRFRRKDRTEAPAPSLPPLSPYEAAQREFSELEIQRVNKRISLRDLASKYSFAIRSYLEQRMKFSAAEQTVTEVCAEFPARIKKTLPTFTRERGQEMTAELKALLRFFEQLAFSNRSSEVYHLDSDELIVNAKRSFEFIKILESHIKKEEERMRSVTEARLPPPELPGGA